VRGIVTGLQRTTPRRGNVVTISGVVTADGTVLAEGRDVQLRGISDEVYATAIDAHREEQRVEASGVVTLRARTAYLDEVEGFRIL
jgi:hypothetical protein